MEKADGQIDRQRDFVHRQKDSRMSYILREKLAYKQKETQRDRYTDEQTDRLKHKDTVINRRRQRDSQIPLGQAE